MKSKLISTAAVCALITLTGCAGGTKPTAFDNQKSEAMNVVAAAYGWSTADRFYRDAPPEPTHNTEKAIGVATAGAAANTLPGVSLSATSIGVGVVSSLLSSPDNPAIRTEVIFWMPVSRAKDGTEASKVASRMFADALAKTMKQHGVPVREVKESESWPDYVHQEVFAAKHSCKNLHPEIIPDVPVASVGLRELSNRPIPQWIGNGEAWGVEAGFNVNACAKRGLDRIALIRDFSAKLPEWAYVQAGATNTRGPILFHQGKELRFITPQ